jgi:hypothetical protein
LAIFCITGQAVNPTQTTVVRSILDGTSDLIGDTSVACGKLWASGLEHNGLHSEIFKVAWLTAEFEFEV